VALLLPCTGVVAYDDLWELGCGETPEASLEEPGSLAAALLIDVAAPSDCVVWSTLENADDVESEVASLLSLGTVLRATNGAASSPPDGLLIDKGNPPPLSVLLLPPLSAVATVLRGVWSWGSVLWGRDSAKPTCGGIVIVPGFKSVVPIPLA
jgi:hypothetical protein